MVVVLVHLLVQQVKDRDLHHTLVEVCCSIFDHLDSDHFLSLEILAFDDLPKCSLSKYVQNQISILMTRLLRT